ncbi:MAG: ferrous iron transport protein B [Acidobacteria bacterium]|nr:ferrous iron transport protein B [Acidobacteriota bacterium]
MQATIALAGNPNSGKTTLFNALTGARQHVGNYPGVTVETKEGVCSHRGGELRIVDLPGTYSLTAYSMEEIVTRDFLTGRKPDVVIDVVDASNLERNLFLAVQLMEMGAPLVLCLNMVDAARNRGIEVDAGALSTLLGVEVVPTVARTGKGREALLDAAVRKAQDGTGSEPLVISYGNDLDEAIASMQDRIRSRAFLAGAGPARWIALKYLEEDAEILGKGDAADPELSASLREVVRKVSLHIARTLDTEPEALISDQRYGYIHALLREGIVRRQHDENRMYVSDRIDRFLTHRLLGPLVMLVVVMGLYRFMFTYSERPVEWVEGIFAWLGRLASAHLPEGMLRSLVVSGVIDGVGGVLSFVPLILLMFFGIAFLEDSGYLARVAFMLDRVFRIFGLHGNSVMAFIVAGGIAGGCAVPGVMAARTLRSPRERLATILTVPFMNCGAKLPVFAVLIAAFFAEARETVMFAITLISWAGALLAAKLLRSTVIRGPATPFVMELPPYRVPTLRGLLIHTWERTWQYIKKAGTVILAIAIVLWAMMTFPALSDSHSERFERERAVILASASTERAGELEAVARAEAEAGLRHSVAGRIGGALERVTRWAGFDWRTNIALLGGFGAKEVVVSTLGTAYSLGEVDPERSGGLAETLATNPGWNRAVAWSLIIFTIFYAPCSVTVVCIVREAGSWKWGAFSVLFNTAVAFALAVIVYQAGMALGAG